MFNEDTNNPTGDNSGNATPNPSFNDTFSAMEQTLGNVPEGEFITLRHGSGSPVYVPLLEREDGTREDGLTVRQACERAHLAVGTVNVYVDQNMIGFDTFVAAGTVVTLVGNVKGG